MVQLDRKQKRLLKIGIIILLALSIVTLIVLIGRSKPDITSSVPVTPATGRFPTLAPPQTDTEGNPGPNEILIKDFSFHPPVLRIKAGTAITIFNADSAGHSVTSNEVVFDTGILSQHEQGTLTFDTPGTYSYHCRRHPAMSASIVVTP